MTYRSTSSTEAIRSSIVADLPEPIYFDFWNLSVFLKKHLTAMSNRPILPRAIAASEPAWLAF